jgi:hypothetical protein
MTISIKKVSQNILEIIEFLSNDLWPKIGNAILSTKNKKKNKKKQRVTEPELLEPLHGRPSFEEIEELPCPALFVDQTLVQRWNLNSVLS